MYGKLETQLIKKKTAINGVIEVANQAYQERDKMQSQLAAMIQQSDKEQDEFNSEIQAVQELIEKDNHMKRNIVDAKNDNQIQTNKVIDLKNSLTATNSA